jgi:hypothetical protein
MRYTIVLITVAVMAFLVMDFNERTAELNRLRAEKEAVQLQLKSREATRTVLESKIEYAVSDAAVEKWAYEHHMVRQNDGDIAVVPIQVVQITPTPKPKTTVIVTEQNNPDYWLALFFDPSPPTP